MNITINSAGCLTYFYPLIFTGMRALWMTPKTGLDISLQNQVPTHINSRRLYSKGIVPRTMCLAQR